MARLFLMVGLPGAGKTTEARRLAEASTALLLTPDAWLIPLVGLSEGDSRRDVLEGRFVWTAVQVLRAGVDVVLDFGFWTRAERASLHWLATSIGVECTTVYREVDRDTQWARIRRRWEETPEQTFPISEADVDRWRTAFEVPDAAELAGRPATDPPDGWASWPDWVADRWPTSLD